MAQPAKSTKHQAPNTREASNTKFQAPDKRQAPNLNQAGATIACSGAWNLELFWSLELGFWSLLMARSVARPQPQNRSLESALSFLPEAPVSRLRRKSRE